MFVFETSEVKIDYAKKEITFLFVSTASLFTLRTLWTLASFSLTCFYSFHFDISTETTNSFSLLHHFRLNFTRHYFHQKKSLKNKNRKTLNQSRHLAKQETADGVSHLDASRDKTKQKVCINIPVSHCHQRRKKRKKRGEEATCCLQVSWRGLTSPPLIRWSHWLTKTPWGWNDLHSDNSWLKSTQLPHEETLFHSCNYKSGCSPKSFIDQCNSPNLTTGGALSFTVAWSNWSLTKK